MNALRTHIIEGNLSEAEAAPASTTVHARLHRLLDNTSGMADAHLQQEVQTRRTQLLDVVMDKRLPRMSATGRSLMHSSSASTAGLEQYAARSARVTRFDHYMEAVGASKEDNLEHGNGMMELLQECFDACPNLYKLVGREQGRMEHMILIHDGGENDPNGRDYAAYDPKRVQDKFLAMVRDHQELSWVLHEECPKIWPGFHTELTEAHPYLHPMHIYAERYWRERNRQSVPAVNLVKMMDVLSGMKTIGKRPGYLEQVSIENMGKDITKVRTQVEFVCHSLLTDWVYGGPEAPKTRQRLAGRAAAELRAWAGAKCATYRAHQQAQMALRAV